MDTTYPVPGNLSQPLPAGAERWRCDCGAILDVTYGNDWQIWTESTEPASQFRCVDMTWEHNHGYPAGHVKMRRGY